MQSKRTATRPATPKVGGIDTKSSGNIYESEVNSRKLPTSSVPQAVLDEIGEYRRQVRARTVLPWGEHCTECVWPSCYSTCELYEPRIDGNCRQFIGGVTRIPTPDGTVPYLQKIAFRRWAKLWTVGTTVCQSLEAADRLERINLVAGTLAKGIPVPSLLRQKLLNKMSYTRRNKLTSSRRHGEGLPDFFVVEVFNPSPASIALSLSIRAAGKRQPLTFQRLIYAEPRLQREKVPFDEIRSVVDTDGPFEVEIVPNDAESATLYFGLMDFVQENGRLPQPSARGQGEVKMCKCVVWDLDNTLWDGILMEDGPESVVLRDDIRHAIEELDRRGVLQSVASKNDADETRVLVERLGLDEYFLFPQIHWAPKSQSITAIAKALNIGLDSVVFVDDQEFERQEVSSALPEVRVADPTTVAALLESPAFKLPVTEESRTRRLMYSQEEQRVTHLAAYRGDYLEFLRDNQMRVTLSPLTNENIRRVYELAQRTNQMNFSGNRYAIEELQNIAKDARFDTYVIDCSDRFGSYGIVGFSVVDRDEPRLLDLMFSCRVQSKRVEHGFLTWLLAQHRARGQGGFFVNYRKTSKNEPSGAVFDDIGFQELSVVDGVTLLYLGHDRDVSPESVVSIIPVE